jgi:LacI family transcriptional regulator
MSPTPASEQPEKIVRLQDIADHCGIHITTVSLALRGMTKRVNAETMARVQAAAVALGYNPATTHFARRMRAARTGVRLNTHMIATMVPWDFANIHYFYTIFHGILQTLTREGYGVFTTFADDQIPGRDFPSPPALERGELDGAIWLAPTYHLAQTLQSYRGGVPELPIVTLMHQYPGLPSVVAEDERGAYAAAAHLLALGHRHLLHFHPPGYDSIATARRRGYARACTEAGLDPTAVLHECKGFQPYGKDPAARDWVWTGLAQSFTEHPDITGILGQSDFVSDQVYDALRLAGLRVPEELSLVGFDDTHVIPGPTGANMLTTVRVPLFDLGVEAARLLLALLRGEAAADTQRVLPVDFVPRASTAPPRTTGPLRVPATLG